jgi:hypothetical protein
VSHCVTINTELKSLEAIRLACKQLNLVWREGQKHFAWFGTSVGDYALPQGFKASDMGRCEHAIGIPGTEWEVGVVRCRKADGTPDEGYTLLFDFFGFKGGPILTALGGQQANKFVQEYAAQQSVLLAQKKGHAGQILRTEQEVKRFNELHRVSLKFIPGKVYVGITGRSL